MQTAKYSNQDLSAISKYLNLFPSLILLSIAAHFFPPVFILSGPLFLYFGYQLAKAAKLGKPILWGAAAVIPVLGFGCVFVLVYKSARILKENGIKVGILGAGKPQPESPLKNESD